MTFIAVCIGQIFHAVPDAAGGLPLDDYASILAWTGWMVKVEKVEKVEQHRWKSDRYCNHEDPWENVL